MKSPLHAKCALCGGDHLLGQPCGMTSVAASGSVVCKVRDTICHGCVIRPLPDMGAGPRYRVTLIRTGEAREVRMPSLYDCLSNLTVENRLITVMNALEWSDPLNDQVSNPHPDKTP